MQNRNQLNLYNSIGFDRSQAQLSCHKWADMHSFGRNNETPISFRSSPSVQNERTRILGGEDGTAKQNKNKR